jgi:vancomycin aglycone glucosyltransferase
VRVLLSTYGSRGDAEPMVGLAVRLRALGAQVRVCAPPDEEFAELPARVGVPVGRVAEKGRPCPREPHRIIEPGPGHEDLDTLAT